MTRTLTPQQKIALNMCLLGALIRMADQFYGHLLPHSLRHLPLILVFTVAVAGTYLLFRVANSRFKGFLVLYIAIFVFFLIVPFIQ